MSSGDIITIKLFFMRRDRHSSIPPCGQSSSVKWRRIPRAASGKVMRRFSASHADRHVC